MKTKFIVAALAAFAVTGFGGCATYQGPALGLSLSVYGVTAGVTIGQNQPATPAGK